MYDWLLAGPRRWSRELRNRYLPTPDQRQIREQRARSRTEFGPLFDEVAALLFRDDPIGINFEFNKDEYEPEAETILPRLYLCKSSDDVLTVVVEEFDHWFSPAARPPERYRKVAGEIWDAWSNNMVRKT